ncbi:MAG: FAD-binding oxidoreductase [Promethearchaeota archaeon]|nr:MAG: FAD-binding oxidoreductase [Candidatus Lokiarchaeota archaeon]
MQENYDIIIIGAGSIGVPTAMFIGTLGLSVLVLDKNSSPGQGENKHAIGGVRATHTNKGKILLALKSLDIFSNWQEKYGEDIEWIEGGYVFLAYTNEIKQTLKTTLNTQQSSGLEINFYGPERIKSLIPGININNLMGGTYSPYDGSVSPLAAINAFYRHAKRNGVDFRFNEKVIDIKRDDNIISELFTNNNKSYSADWIINAAGPGAKQIGKLIDIELPIYTESHEAGVTEPVKRFFEPMVVDLRKSSHSKNFYFYQDKHGSIVFCLTPDPPIIGTNENETSEFLPQISKRMVDLLPRLRNLKVRRTWRGLYPMSPDGKPIIGKVKDIDNYINANGMCGQGFMLGPGIGGLIKRIIADELTDDDKLILKEFSLYRDFDKVEKLK